MFNKLAVLTVSAVLLSACLGKSAQTNSETSQPAPEADQYAAVAAALQAGKSATCTIAKTDGTSTMEYHAKGKKVRVSGIASADETGNQYSSMLMDETFIYTWDDAKKEGIKFTVPDPAATTAPQQPQVPDFSQETAREAYMNDGYTVDCAVGEVPDSVFTPPSDVQFTDASKMMEGAQEMMQQLNTQQGSQMSPEDQAALEEQTRQMMQQFGQ